MNSQIIGLRVAGAIFGLMCLLQLLRLLIGLEIVVAGNRLPLWTSAIACAVTGALSAWMWILSCPRRG